MFIYYFSSSKYVSRLSFLVAYLRLVILVFQFIVLGRWFPYLTRYWRVLKVDVVCCIISASAVSGLNCFAYTNCNICPVWRICRASTMFSFFLERIRSPYRKKAVFLYYYYFRRLEFAEVTSWNISSKGRIYTILTLWFDGD